MLKKSFCLILLCLFSYSFQASSKTIVVSDIDDTLKKSNSVGYAGEQVYHFLRKVPYFEMRDLFLEIKDNEKGRGENVKFYYVSAARSYTFKAQKWLQKHHFPLGRATLKQIGEKRETYDFKYQVIKKILMDEMLTLDVESAEPFNVMLFGDNAQVDADVYSALSRELNLDAKIYIRDVRTFATYFDSTLEVKQIPGVTYYFSEVELFQNTEFDYLSPELIQRTYESYKNKTLIPAYTFKTMNRRLEELYQEKDRAKIDALKYWNDYYSRF